MGGKIRPPLFFLSKLFIKWFRNGLSLQRDEIRSTGNVTDGFNLKFRNESVYEFHNAIA